MTTVRRDGGIGDDDAVVPVGRPGVNLDEPYFRFVIALAASVRRCLPLYAVAASGSS